MVCGVKHIKDNNCLGDYYQTEAGYVLQSTCPICGRMEPLIMGRNQLSRRKMKEKSRFLANEFGQDYDVCKEVAMKSDGTDFIHLFSQEFHICEEIISELINNGAKNTHF